MSEDLYLYPEDLIVRPTFLTRLWPGPPLDVTPLVESIKQNGQIDSGIVIQDPEEKEPRYLLVIGHRRRQAIALINQELSGPPDLFMRENSLQKMRVRLDRTGDAFRKGIISNWNLANYSPMDKAAMIARLRRLNGWYHRPGTDRIAHYLGISAASVIQYEKFMKADPALQAALHAGTVAPESAFDVIKAVEVQAAAVLTLARRLEDETGKVRGVSSPPAARIRRPSILAAIDKLRTNDKRRQPAKTRAEILRFLAELDIGGYVNGDRSQFLKVLCMWAQGSATDSHVIELFNKLCKNADPGFHEVRGGAPRGKPHRRFSPRIMPNIDRNAIDI